MDEQGLEIQEALADYYANPERYSFADLEEIFQDRDPMEFLWKRYSSEGVKGIVGFKMSYPYANV